MVNIKPIVNILAKSANKAARFVERPNLVRVNPSTLRPAIDEVCLSTKPCSISIEEVKKLFPTGKLENNYIINDIKDLLGRIKQNARL